MRHGFPASLVVVALVAGCGSDGGGERTVTVTETAGTGTKTAPPDPATPAEALVSENGFTQVKRTAYYGAVLLNESATQEALRVKVTVRARDRRGDVLAREVVDVSAVPPGGQFNVGGALQLGAREKVDEVEVVAKTGDSAPPEKGIARVTNVRVEPQEYGGLRVHALIDNTLPSNLPARARVFAVLRDGDNQVIAGLSGSAGHVIRPRERAPVELDLTDDLPAAVKAGVSVESEIAP